MQMYVNCLVLKKGWKFITLWFHADAQCVSLPDDKNEGLRVIRNDEDSVLVPFRENVTLHCGNTGRQLRRTSSSGFRQCVYDPKPGASHYIFTCSCAY